MKTLLDCVLIIDDDEPTNYLNELVIASSGCTRHIKSVQSGEEALNYLAHSGQGQDTSCPTPNLIFLDINMPAMNGWEFLDRYRQLCEQKGQQVIIVMLTTSLFPEDAQKARERPEVSGFEHKPLTTEKLERILQTYFTA